ncbi:MAG: AMP-binding protein [Myxococcota bacterium]
MTTLLNLLERALDQHNPALRYSFLPDGKAASGQHMPFHTLAERALALGHWLREHVKPGERVMLLHPPGLDFLVGFFGCLCAPCIAVPVYPPDPSRLARTLPRLAGMAADCKARHILTTAPARDLLRPYAIAHAPELAALTWLDQNQAPNTSTTVWPHNSVDPDTAAFLQYTSGSTRAPRGVVVTHGNLIANLALMHRAFDNGPDSHAVNWLPLYHDMGLIGAILQPLFAAHPATFMSPLTFLAKPATWLRAISAQGGTHCGGPNFGYHLCTRRIRDDELEGVDLSCWRLAFNGAEPIQDTTLRRFSERFAPWGFRPEAHFPCYGLAESTLFVSGGPIERTPERLQLDPDAIAQGQLERSPRGRTVVSCG